MKVKLSLCGLEELLRVISNLGELSPYCKSVVRDLGVLLDSSLTFKKQINSVVKSAFFCRFHGSKSMDVDPCFCVLET